MLLCTYQTTGHDTTEGYNIGGMKIDKIYAELVGLGLQGKISKTRPRLV